ncbi:MAG: hypothetical protein MI919_18790, partial [Holophagales bacterium]|nr:hypothetical protein [Holophagales bacterium]
MLRIRASRPSIFARGGLAATLAVITALLLALPGTVGAEESQTLRGHLLFEWGDPHPARPGPAIERVLLAIDGGPTRELEVSRELLAGGVFRWNGRRVEVHPAAASATSTGPLPVAALTLLGGENQAVPASSTVSGSQPWVSILCKFADIGEEPENLAYFTGMYANVAGGLDHYWREVSYDQIDVVGSTAVDWKVLPNIQTHYIPVPGEGANADLNEVFDDCTAAADPFIDFSNGGSPFAGINIMLNGDLDCCAWGGGRFATLDGVSKVWRTTWNPPWSFANEGIIAHEMGHGFGLPHANNWDGDGNPYDSPWDVMSSATGYSTDHPTYGRLGKHVNSYHKDRLGWIAAQRQIEVTAPSEATITLDHTALATTSNYRLATIPVGDGSWYTVEARKRVGTYEGSLPGDAVILHHVVPGRSEPSWAVDGDVPPSNYADNPGTMWTSGETFEDPAANISVEVLSETADGFVVRITSGGPSAIFDDGFESGNLTEWS